MIVKRRYSIASLFFEAVYSRLISAFQDSSFTCGVIFKYYSLFLTEVDKLTHHRFVVIFMWLSG